MALLEPETMVIGDTTFQVGQMPASVGWDLSAKVANIMGTTKVENPIGLTEADGLAGVMAGVRALMAIPADQLKEVRDELFKYVEFSNSMAKTPQVLHGAVPMAFDGAGLTSLDIWKVFMAAFRVNFSEYWEMLNSLLPGLQNILRSKLSDSPDPSQP